MYVYLNHGSSFTDSQDVCMYIVHLYVRIYAHVDDFILQARM